MTPLISAKELKDSREFALLDVRGGPDAHERYAKGHLAGAIFIDVETELSTKTDPKRGGRHPLPSPGKFSALLTQLGINSKSNVVVYDDKLGANAAARMWWMLRAAGITNTRMLDGGYQSAINEGMEVSTDEVKRIPGVDYNFDDWLLPLADMNEVQAASEAGNKIIVDVREAYRYNGESEPIDLVAGHIPNAINVPYPENLDSHGKFLPVDELNTKYRKIFENQPAENVIVHCGSGITACHTLLAMELAGIHGAKLYVGSWSEWSRNSHP